LDAQVPLPDQIARMSWLSLLPTDHNKQPQGTCSVLDSGGQVPNDPPAEARLRRQEPASIVDESTMQEKY